MQSSPAVSVVLPVHNQGDHIEGVLRGFADVLERLARPWEIVVVPNACRDHTVEACAAVAADVPQVSVVDLGAAGGWGRAVKAGLRAARGETLAYTNSARTSPEILTITLAYAMAHPDVVVKANRRVRDNVWRRLGSLLYNLECRALFDLAVWDVNGTPKVFPRQYARLLELEADDDMVDAEFAAVCVREGYPIIEVPMLATTRHGGSSTTGHVSAVRMYVGAVALRRRIGRS
jgi:glycosyltransferase involved in cell wall biosynthesis